MPSLHFKGKAFVQHHHLVVPYHELTPVKSKGLSPRASLHDNLIVHGDNLRALKALLPTHAGKVKCIYIDPPYNTGNEGWAYNDNVSSPMLQEWLGQTVDRDDLTRHDKWCCMMLPRLKLLREFLTDDGAIFVSIDDNEVHRLRCLMDEVFGEENFVANIVWQKRYSRDNRPALNAVHDHIVVYARTSVERFKKHRNLFDPDEASTSVYRNPNNDPRGRWRPVPMTAQGHRKNQMYRITTPTGKVHEPPPGRCWSTIESEFKKLLAAGDDQGVSKRGRIWFGKDGDSQPNLIRYLDEIEGFVPWTWFTHEFAGHTDEAKKDIYEVLGSDDAFATPKPVRLIKRLLELYTDADGGDIVMDSFAGSGTTAHAVLALNKADGGNRRFVIVEGEDYADTITAERVRRVIKGLPSARDEALRAGLGGTFSYFKLGQPLSLHSILEGKDLPDYAALASYLFFTATGEEFDPKQMKRREHFIGTSRLYDVFLLYTEDPEKLKGLALTLDIAHALRGPGGKQRLVFAPTKYLDEYFLDRLRITFQQLPFQIYQTLDR